MFEWAAFEYSSKSSETVGFVGSWAVFMDSHKVPVSREFVVEEVASMP